MKLFSNFLASNFLNRIGGGEDPKQPIYTSKQQIDKDNAFTKAFLQRHGAPQWQVENSVVGRNVGDRMPFFQQSPLRSMQGNGLTELPSGITINDVVQTNEGYGFFHPQQGNWIPVDAQAVFQKYGNKASKK